MAVKEVESQEEVDLQLGHLSGATLSYLDGDGNRKYVEFDE